MSEVQIKCIGADVVSIHDLHNFQGDLKSLPDDSYLRLKTSIVELGFSFPVAAWRDGERIMILDAHQRVETLKRMEAEGFTVPLIPVIWVEAQDRKEAAKKLLAATSQYGKIEVDGLKHYMDQFEISMADLEYAFTFPEVDFESFKLTYFPELTQMVEESSSEYAEREWRGMPEFDQESKEAFRRVIVHMKDEEAVKKFFELLGQEDTGQTKSIWFPKYERRDLEAKRY